MRVIRYYTIVLTGRVSTLFLQSPAITDRSSDTSRRQPGVWPECLSRADCFPRPQMCPELCELGKFTRVYPTRWYIF